MNDSHQVKWIQLLSICIPFHQQTTCRILFRIHHLLSSVCDNFSRNLVKAIACFLHFIPSTMPPALDEWINRICKLTSIYRFQVQPLSLDPSAKSCCELLTYVTVTAL